MSKEKHWSGIPKRFWSYDATDPGPPPFGWNERDWYSFSPGMRREIKKNIHRQMKIKYGVEN